MQTRAKMHDTSNATAILGQPSVGTINCWAHLRVQKAEFALNPL